MKAEQNVQTQPLNQAFDLVCFAHLRWNFVFQRPNHLMSRWAAHQRVFYIEEPEIDQGPVRMEVKQDRSGVWVATPYLPEVLSKEDGRREHIRLIDELLASHNVRQYVSWYYTPMAVDYTRHLHPLLKVYDCMDDLSSFVSASPKLKSLEAELMQTADLVFCGGRSLYLARKDRHADIHLFPSSIDLAHFCQARQEQPDPADQAAIPHPRLGFFGVIDERMDLELLGRLAEQRPDWHLVLVGPVVKVNPKRLPHQPNVHYLGKKDYQELPAYLAGWDVALMPFALNKATHFISPTKTLEYLAGGRPVVSTPIPDVVTPYGQEGVVWIAAEAGEFARHIHTALSLNGDLQAWRQRVDTLLASTSWDQTWEAMAALVQDRLQKRTPLAWKGADATPGRPITPSSADGWVPPLNNQTLTQETVTAAPGSAAYPAYNRGKPLYDYLIVGAGFAGSVLAERLARGSGKRVLLIDKRNHIAGNAYDHYNDQGVLVHRYGPHIFHTNSRDVFVYLSQFTRWRQYEHRVLASVDGQLLPIPINLDTINRLFGLNLSSMEVEAFFQSLAEPRDPVLTSEDVVVGRVGRQLYEKFFRNYTRKQWGLDPSELDAQVTARVPVRQNRDDRYFADQYQAMPLHGYTRMFENMLDHPNISIMLNTDYRDVYDLIPHQEMIYTGPVDEYFGYCYGRLPYRSLKFHFETLDGDLLQPVAVINYPNEHLYTRVTEFKHLTGQEHTKTTLVYEYPCDEGDPYYPVPTVENADLYKQYKARAEATPNVHFVGRLATYRYYNMDQVTAQALTLYARLTGQARGDALTSQAEQPGFSIEMPCMPVLLHPEFG